MLECVYVCVSVVRILLTQQERGLLSVLYKAIKKMLLEQWLN